MKEMNLAQLETWIKLTPGTVFVYVYTSMCGTCKLAERMLNVIETMMPQLPLVKVNILEFARVMEQRKIQSVPCLMTVRDGIVIDKRYAFHSVDYLYREIFQPSQHEMS